MLPPLPVADLPEAPLEDPIGSLHWKTAALVAVAAGRRFVWLDDEISDIDRAWVGALLHVDPRSGLPDADLAVVGDWHLENAYNVYGYVVRNEAGDPYPSVDAVQAVEYRDCRPGRATDPTT